MQLESKVPGTSPTKHPAELRAQPRYEAPGGLLVESVEMQWLTLAEWSCPLNNDPKLTVGQANSS